MSWRHYFISFGLVSAFVLIGDPLSKATFIILAVAALLWAIPFYFETHRNRDKEASVTETLLATAWLWIRRIIGFIGGSLFILAGIWGFFVPMGRYSNLDHIYFSTAAVLIGLFCYWVALRGQGYRQVSLKDDSQLHAINRKRYKWK